MRDSKLISQFKDTARKAGATTEEIDSSGEALYDSLLEIAGGSENILMSEPEFIPVDLFTKIKEKFNIVTKPDTDELAAAEVGITDAFAGIARTGSVCIAITPGFSSYISLLPRKHIVILESKNIVARPRDIFENHILKSTIDETGWIFISGPSATADMGELVRGVHGPDKLHIILLG
ncbi:MAG: LUD domain-containing protein [Ignavibacteriaceae bacterium]